MLFVPGDSPAKMAKALLCTADALILDLEDSVVFAHKAQARACVHECLDRHATARPAQLWVRINPRSSMDYSEDLAAILPAHLDGIVLPKADSAQDFIQLCEDISLIQEQQGLARAAIPILPIATETPISIFRLDTYAKAGSQLAGLTWGAEDLSAAIGAVTCRDETGAFTPLYQIARGLCLAAAAAAGVAAIDTVYPNFKDEAGLRAYCANGRRDGFSGMMAIHPCQIDIINQAFTPSESELELARRVVAVFEANPHTGTVQLDGRMLDAPHLKQARRLLSTKREHKYAD